MSSAYIRGGRRCLSPLKSPPLFSCLGCVHVFIPKAHVATDTKSQCLYYSIAEVSGSPTQRGNSGQNDRGRRSPKRTPKNGGELQPRETCQTSMHARVPVRCSTHSSETLYMPTHHPSMPSQKEFQSMYQSRSISLCVYLSLPSYTKARYKVCLGVEQEVQTRRVERLSASSLCYTCELLLMASHPAPPPLPASPPVGPPLLPAAPPGGIKSQSNGVDGTEEARKPPLPQVTPSPKNGKRLKEKLGPFKQKKRIRHTETQTKKRKNNSQNPEGDVPFVTKCLSLLVSSGEKKDFPAWKELSLVLLERALARLKGGACSRYQFYRETCTDRRPLEATLLPLCLFSHPS